MFPPPMRSAGSLARASKKLEETNADEAVRAPGFLLLALQTVPEFEVKRLVSTSIVTRGYPCSWTAIPPTIK